MRYLIKEPFFKGEETFDSKGQKVIEFYFRDNGKIYCRKDRGKLNPPSVLRNVATTKQGSTTLKEIFKGEEPIKFVKPVQLLKYLFSLLPKNIQILDFFAGSGTSLHAAIEMNEEDKGLRQVIISTNNENNICEEVTYERNRRVIQGYTNSKGEWVPGLTNNNLRYYKTEFVDSAKTEENRRKLTQLSSALLQIKEDCYEELVLPETIASNQAQAFTNGKGKYLLVVYHHRKQTETSATLTEWIKQLTGVEGKLNCTHSVPKPKSL
jgi:adenine-specific DNA-methyltransferase